MSQNKLEFPDGDSTAITPDQYILGNLSVQPSQLTEGQWANLFFGLVHQIQPQFEHLQGWVKLEAGNLWNFLFTEVPADQQKVEFGDGVTPFTRALPLIKHGWYITEPGRDETECPYYINTLLLDSEGNLLVCRGETSHNPNLKVDMSTCVISRLSRAESGAHLTATVKTLSRLFSLPEDILVGIWCLSTLRNQAGKSAEAHLKASQAAEGVEQALSHALGMLTLSGDTRKFLDE